MKRLGELRFCTAIVHGIIEIDNQDEPGTMPIFSSGIGEIINDIVDVYYRGLPPVHRSIVNGGEFGSSDPVTGSFTGCAASIISNKSDIAWALINYPLDDSVERVFP